jgi:hypothetical protein
MSFTAITLCVAPECLLLLLLLFRYRLSPETFGYTFVCNICLPYGVSFPRLKHEMSSDSFCNALWWTHVLIGSKRNLFRSVWLHFACLLNKIHTKPTCIAVFSPAWLCIPYVHSIERAHYFKGDLLLLIKGDKRKTVALKRPTFWTFLYTIRIAHFMFLYLNIQE